jgi:hypothetical protein
MMSPGMGFTDCGEHELREAGEWRICALRIVREDGPALPNTTVHRA